MRALLAPQGVVVTAVIVAACSAPGPAVQARLPATAVASSPAVGCDQVIQQVGAPGGRVVLGVLVAPPARLEPGAPTGASPWAYFSKCGIAVRAGSPAVLITVPQAWRHRAAIGWGNGPGAVSSLRVLSCPPQLGPWNAYAGGFYLRSASGCVPLVFAIGGRATTLRFAIGSGNCGSPT